MAKRKYVPSVIIINNDTGRVSRPGRDSGGRFGFYQTGETVPVGDGSDARSGESDPAPASESSVEP